jgi:hypothetical protein
MEKIFFGDKEQGKIGWREIATQSSFMGVQPKKGRQKCSIVSKMKLAEHSQETIGEAFMGYFQ